MTDYTDEQLLTLLRAALEAENPPPTNVDAVADLTYAWRTIDADLAALSYDSVLEPATTRDDGSVRTLAFELNDDVRIDIRIDAERTRIVGQVEPAAEGTAELIHREGAETVDIDDFGVFVFEAIASGPVSILIKVGDRSVRTEWFLP